MTDDFVQIEEKNIVKLKIKTKNGEDTGEYLIFQLDDIDLLLRYQEMLQNYKKNKNWLRNEILIINKKQDIKGKKLLLSKNEEEIIRSYKKYFEKQVEVYDGFLGKDGVKKLLHGRQLGWTTMKEIDEIINKQIMPKLDISMDNIFDYINERYDDEKATDKEVLK